MEENKICTKCNEVKPITEFYLRGDRDTYRSACKQCCGISGKLYNLKNKNRHKEYWIRNKERLQKQKSLYWQKRKEYFAEKHKQWCKDNKEVLKKLTANYRRIPKNKTNRNFSNSVRKALKGNKNGRCWESIIGYNLQDLMKHLESKFQEGMTWENYGYRGWHIDHIIPCYLWQYNSYNDKEFKQCWSLCNLQPLWAKDNMRKNNKV